MNSDGVNLWLRHWNDTLKIMVTPRPNILRYEQGRI